MCIVNRNAGFYLDVLWMYIEIMEMRHDSNFIMEVTVWMVSNNHLVHPGEVPPPHGRHHSCRHRRMLAGSLASPITRAF